MSGVKGRSGRRAADPSELRLKVIDKAWMVLDEYFDSDDITLRQKGEMAAKIASKSIPQEITGDGLVKNYVQIYRPEYESKESIERNCVDTVRND